MDEQIIKSLQGLSTHAEEEALHAWRAGSQSNERHFRAMQELWTLTGEGAPEMREAPPPLSAVLAEAAAAGASGVTGGGGPSLVRELKGIEAPAPAPSGQWFRWAGIAAVAASLVGIGLGLGVVVGRDEANPGSAGVSETVTGLGEMTTVTLADGSSIRLGPNSRLRLSENRTSREAWLDGRAFFGVRADSTRPFTVHTEGGSARMLGTRFEVRSGEEFRVLVVEGRVSVSAGGADVTVTRGQMSRSVGGRRPITEVVEDVYAQLDWLGNALVFSATPLNQVAEELERRYGVQVIIAEGALSELAVTAAFTGQPVEQVLVVICEAISAECVMNGQEVLVRSRPEGDR